VSKGKDIFGVGCAVAAVAIWVAVACSGGDGEPRTHPVDEAAASAPVNDPLQSEFEAAWSGLTPENRDAYCWALESMQPDELAGFSAELAGGDPADWNRVTNMINEKCSER
jgi:hypothetical protein